jgi:hypothetical protein
MEQQWTRPEVEADSSPSKPEKDSRKSKRISFRMPGQAVSGNASVASMEDAAPVAVDTFSRRKSVTPETSENPAVAGLETFDEGDDEDDEEAEGVNLGLPKQSESMMPGQRVTSTMTIGTEYPVLPPRRSTQDFNSGAPAALLQRKESVTMRAKKLTIVSKSLTQVERAEAMRAKASAARINVVPTVGNVTVSQLEYTALEVKTGFLMKQSRNMMRIWKKKWVVLDGDVIYFYDRKQDEGSRTKVKSWKITKEYSTSYASKENTFCIKLSPKAHESTFIYLIAKDQHDMESWILHINAHIHLAYCSTLLRRTDYWDEGDINTTFWMMPQSTKKYPMKPFAIRTLPMKDAPRSGEGVYPGEVIEVVESIEDFDNRYLRLDNDRGWVCIKDAVTNKTLFHEVEGEHSEKFRWFEYVPDRNIGLPVYSGPGPHNDLTGMSLQPRMKFMSSAVWVMMNPDKTENTYIKLADSPGWVLAENHRGETVIRRLPDPES